MTTPRRISAPRARICARCGPLRYGRKLDRHHPAIYSTFFPYVSGWRSRHKRFLAEDVVSLCARCHLDFHEDLATPLLWQEWYYIPRRFRDEPSALAASSAVSALFWNWLEQDSYARRTAQLRWSADSTQCDAPLLSRPILSTSTHSRP